MPIIKSAKKKLKQDKKRAAINRIYRRRLKDAVKEAEKKKTAAVIQQLYRTLDRAVKRGIIHRNKAARLKSRLAKK
jgi:small subunit ribosomal protein S20